MVFIQNFGYTKKAGWKINKGQVTARCYGLYANAHQGKVRKTSFEAFPLRMVKVELWSLHAKGREISGVFCASNDIRTIFQNSHSVLDAPFNIASPFFYSLVMNRIGSHHLRCKRLSCFPTLRKGL